MTTHLAGLGFPGIAIRLPARLEHRLTRVLEGMRLRDEVRSSVPLRTGERVLAMARDSGGRWVAASDRALYHDADERSGPAGPHEWVRVGWEEIAAVSWDDRACSLTFTGLVPTVRRRTVLHLPTGATLGLLARERVAWTTVVQTTIQLGDHGTARVIGRRRPGSEELTWLVGLDGGIDSRDVPGALDRALNDLRARLGLCATGPVIGRSGSGTT